MRITTGSAKGRQIPSPKGVELRPSTDRLRLALFNILGPSFEGSSFLDLFCGSGAVGLEALSRGAGKVVFADSKKACVEQAKALATAFGFDTARWRAVQAPYERALEGLAEQGERFDVVFVDPPYDAALGLPALRELVRLAIVAPGERSRVLLERSSDDAPPKAEGLRLLKDHAYGRSSLAVYALESA